MLFGFALSVIRFECKHSADFSRIQPGGKENDAVLQSFGAFWQI
jgi:hypothetical protein